MSNFSQSSHDIKQYNHEKTYQKGDRIVYEGIVYEAVFWSQAKNPQENNGDYGKEWKKVTQSETKDDALSLDIPLLDDKSHGMPVSQSLESHPIEKWFIEEFWHDLFPKENYKCFEGSIPYSFNSFVEAVRHFPHFANSPSEIEQKKEVAALLGMCLQEVGGKSLKNEGVLSFPGLTKTISAGFSEPSWDNIASYRWNLAFSSETGAERSTNYDIDYPLQPNQKYFSGAGILQLSYPANYARFSEYYFGDKNVLLDNSDRVRKEGELAIGSGIFFWMSQVDARPSPHCCFTGYPVDKLDEACFKRISMRGYKQGLAMAICAVNGIECGIPADYRVATRVYGYLEYGKYFGLSENQLLENCSLETADMPKNLNVV